VTGFGVGNFASERLLATGVAAAEAGLLPDPLLRLAARRFCRRRLRAAERECSAAALADWRQRLSVGPIAPEPASANRQHYEVPTEFFLAVLGPRLKYSCCYWPPGTGSLAEAETAALESYRSRAGICDGMHVLDLGCGWGSLALWLAETVPGLRVTAVSNSLTQASHIRSQARSRGLENIECVTADVNFFEPGRRFDRVVSVEMFEHLRNYRALLARIRTWLTSDGRLFVHVFAHDRFTYGFEPGGAGDWVAKYFFSGGLMPGRDLIPCFDEDFTLERHWWWDGRHYQLTAEAWLARMDGERDRVMRVLTDAHGPREAERWYNRWRLFFVACAEQWGFAGGRQWGVGHYLLAPRVDASG
jgi:cyclopropane-fatty-acyl-phospholipid synthase